MKSNGANKRSRTKRLVFFNHKGGVGKTTLNVNLAAALGELEKKVLLVDSDPQCNLTSYLIEDTVVDDLLNNSDTDTGRTIWSALKPISEGIGSFKQIQPYELNLKNLFLLPGDIRLSEFESDLSEFWGQCLQRKIKGFRGTTALSSLINAISEEYDIDYIFYDTGPNIGPLNRIVLLDCDFFVVPVYCDLFSLRALNTLGRTLSVWINHWFTIADLAPKDIYLLPGLPKFLGYIPSNFRVYRQQVMKAQSGFLSKIREKIRVDIVNKLQEIDKRLAIGRISEFNLGQVKNFGSLVPDSQKEGVPIYEVSTGNMGQKQIAKEVFESIAKKIVEKTN